MKLEPLYPDDGGWIDHQHKLVDWDSWAESGGTAGLYARHGYRPSETQP